MPLELVIVTPEREVLRDSVETVVLPGSEGAFGVLPGHECFLTPLAIGEIEVQPEGRAPLFAAISEGFAEIREDHVTVMVETCELADEIDEARAERARVRAERELEQLAAARAEERRFRAAEAALRRALTRLSVARRRRAG